MIEVLKDADRALFLFLNGLNHPALDQLMYLMTGEMFWIPVFAWMLWMVYKAYGWKIALLSLLGVALTITLGDRISTELFKNVFLRYRPTHNADIGDLVYTVNDYRGGKYGFVSSHATNSAALAVFIYGLVRQKFPRMSIGVFVWAAIFSYTRIYLGVHYPADILCGALLGACIGYLVYFGFRKVVLKNLK